MRTIIGENLGEAGSKVGIALRRKDPRHPRAHVAPNSQGSMIVKGVKGEAAEDRNTWGDASPNDREVKLKIEETNETVFTLRPPFFGSNTGEARKRRKRSLPPP